MLRFGLYLSQSQDALRRAGGVGGARITPTIGVEKGFVDDATFVNAHQLVTGEMQAGEFQVVPNVLSRFARPHSFVLTHHKTLPTTIAKNGYFAVKTWSLS